MGCKVYDIVAHVFVKYSNNCKVVYNIGVKLCKRSEEMWKVVSSFVCVKFGIVLYNSENVDCCRNVWKLCTVV